MAARKLSAADLGAIGTVSILAPMPAKGKKLGASAFAEDRSIAAPVYDLPGNTAEDLAAFAAELRASADAMRDRERARLERPAAGFDVTTFPMPAGALGNHAKHHSGSNVGETRTLADSGYVVTFACAAAEPCEWSEAAIADAPPSLSAEDAARRNRSSDTGIAELAERFRTRDRVASRAAVSRMAAAVRERMAAERASKRDAEIATVLARSGTAGARMVAIGSAEHREALEALPDGRGSAELTAAFAAFGALGAEIGVADVLAPAAEPMPEPAEDDTAVLEARSWYRDAGARDALEARRLGMPAADDADMVRAIAAYQDRGRTGPIDDADAFVAYAAAYRDEWRDAEPTAEPMPEPTAEPPMRTAEDLAASRARAESDRIAELRAAFPSVIGEDRSPIPAEHSPEVCERARALGIIFGWHPEWQLCAVPAAEIARHSAPSFDPGADPLAVCNACDAEPMVGPEHPAYAAGLCAECAAGQDRAADIAEPYIGPDADLAAAASMAETVAILAERAAAIGDKLGSEPRRTVVDYSAPMPAGFAVVDPFGALAPAAIAEPMPEPERCAVCREPGHTMSDCPRPMPAPSCLVCAAAGMTRTAADHSGPDVDAAHGRMAAILPEPEPTAADRAALRLAAEPELGTLAAATVAELTDRYTVPAEPVPADPGAPTAAEPDAWHANGCILTPAGHAGPHKWRGIAPTAEPAPTAVPTAAPSAGRPTCPRCGQTFRKSGAGYAWHVANRPDCAQSRAAVA